MFWNELHGFFSQNYMLIVLAVFLNNTTVEYDHKYKWLTYNNGVSWVMNVLIYAVPVLLLILTIIYFEDLKDPESSSSKKWGCHMEEIRMQRDLDNGSEIAVF